MNEGKCIIRVGRLHSDFGLIPKHYIGPFENAQIALEWILEGNAKKLGVDSHPTVGSTAYDIVPLLSPAENHLW